MGDEFDTDIGSTDLSDSSDTSTFEAADTSESSEIASSEILEDTSEPSDNFTEDTNLELTEDSYTSETDANFENTDVSILEDNIDYDNEDVDMMEQDEIAEDSYGEESDVVSENQSEYVSEDVEMDENTFESDQGEELQEDVLDDSNEDDPPKVLKRDEFDLLKTGNDAINQRLEAQADDYRDKGLSEEEIEERLAEDKQNYQKEFLEDAFPGQEVSPNVFNGFSEADEKELSQETNDDQSIDEQNDADETQQSGNDYTDSVSNDTIASEDGEFSDKADEELFDDGIIDKDTFADVSSQMTEDESDIGNSEIENNEALTLLEDETNSDEIFNNNYQEDINSDNLIKDLVDQNVSKSAMPKNGEWSDASQEGNSDYIVSDDAEIKWEKNGAHSCTGRELKTWMEENYGVSSVTYDHKEPDFSPFEDKNIGEITADKMSTDRTGGEGTFKYAESVAAERMGMTTAELKQYMSDNELTWHECADRHTIRAIPTRINAAFKHSGGISMQKSVESMATTLSEQHDGASFSLQRESKLGYTDGMQDAIDQQHNNFKQTKKQLFSKGGGK